MIERHWHWEFLAYNDADLDPATGRIQFMVRVRVIGFLCEDDARVAARDILHRDQFRLCDVWECAACGFQQKAAESFAAIVDQSR